jgi:hypothetical protein
MIIFLTIGKFFYKKIKGGELKMCGKTACGKKVKKAKPKETKESKGK